MQKYQWGQNQYCEAQEAFSTLIYALRAAIGVVNQGRMFARLLGDSRSAQALVERNPQKENVDTLSRSCCWLSNSGLISQVLSGWFQWNSLNLIEVEIFCFFLKKMWRRKARLKLFLLCWLLWCNGKILQACFASGWIWDASEAAVGRSASQWDARRWPTPACQLTWDLSCDPTTVHAGEYRSATGQAGNTFLLLVKSYSLK